MKTIKTFIINSGVSGEDKSIILKKTFDSFYLLFSLLNHKTHKIKYIASILRNLNIINDPYILFKLIEKENWTKPNNEMSLNPQGQENLTNFFYDIGINQMNFLLKIINNKFEYLDIPKSKFINLINGKMSSLCDKINIRNIKIDDNSFSHLNESIDYKEILNIFNNNILNKNKNDVTYNKENINNIDKMLNKPDTPITNTVFSCNEHNDDVI